MTAQHFRLENRRLQQEVTDLQRQIKGLQVDVTHLSGLETSNRALRDQLERQTSRLSEAHILGLSLRFWLTILQWWPIVTQLFHLPS